MVNDIRSLAELAGSVRKAYLVVNAALPLPFPVGGVVEAEASPQDVHVMALREAAFDTVLSELLDGEYDDDPGVLHALERGELPESGTGQVPR